MTPTTILIAGIGNIFHGDDAFGCEVAQRLCDLSWPDGIRVADFGIRGIDLAYALADGPELAILIDAAPRGQEPGTVFVIEAEVESLQTADGTRSSTLRLRPEGSVPATMANGHGLNPAAVLQLVGTLGDARPGRVLIVGCEPATLGDEEEGQMGLSPAVEAAVEPAVNKIVSLVNEFFRAPRVAGLAPAGKEMSP
jgi:hydrogenase maturation protease